MQRRVALLVCLVFATGLAFSGGTVGQEEGLLVEGFESGDFSSLPWAWRSTGERYWAVTDSDAHTGSFSAQSTCSAYLVVELTFTEAGYIDFYYKIVGAPVPFRLAFYIDGDRQDAWSEDTDWTQASFPVCEGTHVLVWGASHCWSSRPVVWLDDIRFPDASASTFVPAATCEQQPQVTLFPGQSIQDAIESVEEGAVIKLEPGKYEEHLKIRKSVTICGSGAHDTAIVGGDGGGYAIEVRGGPSTKVWIDGLTIESERGILTYGQSDLTISQCVIKGPLSLAGRDTISECMLKGHIDLNNGSEASIINSTLVGADISLPDCSPFRPNPTPLVLTLTNSIMVGGGINSHHRAKIEGIDFCGELHIEGNRLLYTWGIIVESDYVYGHVDWGCCTRKDEYGRCLSRGRGSSVYIEGNVISESWGSGIELGTCVYAQVMNNVISYSLDNGIYVYSTSWSTIRGNEVFGNGWYGISIHLADDGSSSVSGNRVYENGSGDYYRWP